MARTPRDPNYLMSDLPPGFPADFRELFFRARDAAGRAVASYSGFKVGAAVGDRLGQVRSGCNLESVSYGLSMCAERNAVAAAVADGLGSIERALVFTDTGTPTPPCGACRQVLIERMAPDGVVIAACRHGWYEWSSERLLPDALTRLDQGLG